MMTSPLALLPLLLSCVLAADSATEQAFTSDTGKILQILTGSLYRERQVFLRELISNAADAIVKHRTKKLESGVVAGDVGYDIRLIPDKETRTLTIRDTGVSMAKEELAHNLGTLGASGTKLFQEHATEESTTASNLIGQFGVGFYSVFLVADNVKVAGLVDGSDTQYVWESNGTSTYSIYEDPRGKSLTPHGTEIIMELKNDADEFLEVENLKNHVKQYSEFIDFPIYARVEKKEKVPRKKEDEEKKAEEEKEKTEEEKEEEEEEKEEEEEEEMEEVTTYEWELINEQKPIWTRKTSDIEEEEYNNFYKAITKETENPLYYTHFNAEGEVEFKSILYVPSKAPFGLFDNNAGTMTNIRLYVRRVFITDNFSDLLPRYLNFIRGVVDSDDLPLNVSREVLQENRLLKVIRKKLIRKALGMFQSIADEDEDEEEEKKADKEEKKEAEEAKEDDTKEETKEGDEEGDDKDSKVDKASKEKKYPKFWNEFGKNLRLGLIEDSTNRARLTKLLRYKSNKGDDWVSLEAYVGRMKEKQQGIFYLSENTMEAIKSSPLLEKAKTNDVEVLYMIDAIDEYVVGHITEYSGHKLVNLAKDQVKFFEETETDKKIGEARKDAWKPFVDWCKKGLGSRIEKAQVSTRVVDTPVVLVSPQFGPTARMAQILKAQALSSADAQQQAKRILEINVRHPIIDELRRRVKENEDDAQAKETLEALFDTASLQSGFDLTDPNKFAERMHRLMKQGLNLEANAGLVDEEEYDIDDEPEETEEDSDEEDIQEGLMGEGEDEEGEEPAAADKKVKDEL